MTIIDNRKYVIERWYPLIIRRTLVWHRIYKKKKEKIMIIIARDHDPYICFCSESGAIPPRYKTKPFSID